MCADGPAQKSRWVPPHVLGATAFSTIFRLGHTPGAHTYTSFKTLFEGYPPIFFARNHHGMCADGPAQKSRWVPPHVLDATAFLTIFRLGHTPDAHTYTSFNPLPTSGYPDFSRSGKSAAEFAQEPSQFARMAPGPSRRRGRLAPPTPRIWLTAGALLAVACQGGGERPLETSAGLSLDPWGLAEPPTAAARASEPVIAQSAVGLIRTSGAVPRAPGG